MVFNGMMKLETLYFHLENDTTNVCWVEMEKDCEEGIFFVRVRHMSDEWEWTLYNKNSNYELIKHTIFDIAFDAHNAIELIHGLDEIFEDDFNEIVVWKCCCEHCICKK